MTDKTTLAPTVELATPRVEKFTEKLRNYFGRDAEIVRFYTCDPSTVDVENRQGERWIEGSWGVEILAHGFSIEDMEGLKYLSNSIGVDSIEIRPHDARKIKLSCWLTAKVMR